MNRAGWGVSAHVPFYPRQDLPTIPCPLCVASPSVMVAVMDNPLSWPLIYSRWCWGYCPVSGTAATPDPWPRRSAPGANQRMGLKLMLRGEATWGLEQSEGFVCRKSPDPSSEHVQIYRHHKAAGEVPLKWFPSTLCLTWHKKHF